MYGIHSIRLYRMWTVKYRQGRVKNISTSKTKLHSKLIEPVDASKRKKKNAP